MVNGFWLTTAAAIGALQAAPVAAQVRSFDIPEQPAATGIAAFGKQAGIQIIASGNTVQHKRTNAVKGRLAVNDALNMLLAGTGLEGTTPIANSNMVVVRQARQGVNGSVNGVVVSARTGAPLPGASVRVVGTGLHAITDDRGAYFFPSVPAGERVIEVDYIGEPRQVSTISVSAGYPKSANLQIGSPAKEIVVVGYRSSIQKALNQQKNADNNATIVSSDLLGGFPAETVSEALRRVPGVAFGRDAASGEGSRITVRGFSSEAINVQLNGLDLLGTGFDRTIDLSGFLTDNISQITIQKSLLPSHEATGTGGLVEIETKSALDYGDFSLILAAEGEGNADPAFGEEYQLSGTIAKKLTSAFGISGTLQYRKTDRLNYNVSLLDTIPAILPFDYIYLSNVPYTVEYPFDPGAMQQLVNSVSYIRRERKEESILGSINLAWDVAHHTRLRLDLQRNVRTSVGSTANANAGFFTERRTLPVPEFGGEVRTRTVLGSTDFNGILSTFDTKNTFDTISFRGDTTLGRFDLEYKAGYSRTRLRGSNASVSLTGYGTSSIIPLIDPSTIVINPDDDAAQTPRVVDGGIIFTPNGIPIPSLSEAGIDRLLSADQYYVSSARRSVTDSPSTALVGELQARYSNPVTFIDYIEVGGKYDSRQRKTLDDAPNPLNATFQSYYRISNRLTPLSSFGEGLLAPQDLAVIGVPGFSIPFLRQGSANRLFEQLARLTADDPSTPSYNEERYEFDDITLLDPTQNGSSALSPTKIVEDKLATYLESKFKFGKLDLIAGARWEREKRTGTTFSYPTVIPGPGSSSEPAATFVDVGLYSFTSLSGTVDTVTPSVLATYRPTRNIVARAGYFLSTIHPAITLLNRPTTYSADFRAGRSRITLREANPDLRPSKTDNFDFDLAYYFNDVPGLLRVGAFYKKVSNNFTNVVTATQNDQEVLQRYLDYMQPLAATRPDLLAVPADAEMVLSRPINGDGGKIWGIEVEAIRRLTFLPGLLKDFGILGNATYTNGKFPTLVSARSEDGQTIQLSLDRSLEDQARWVYNLSLDYSRNGFEGRMIYTRQSATAKSFDEFNLNSVTPAYETLDMRLSYSFDRFGGLWTVFFEGDNLLQDADDPEVRSAISSQFGTGSSEFYYPQGFQFNGGRSFTFGLRTKF